MSVRCLDCLNFRETVFVGETESGFGVWSGYCGVKISRRKIGLLEVKNMYFACERFKPTEEAMKNKAHLVYDHLFNTLETATKEEKLSDAIVRLNEAEISELPRQLMFALCGNGLFAKVEIEETQT